MSNDDDTPDNEIKVILLGNSGVGKTNIINIVTGGKFEENEKTTSSASFAVKKMKIRGKEYILNLWDTIGQEQFRQLTKIFYNNSKIVIYVYDITCKESFDDLNYWTKDVEEQIGQDIIKGIVANKMDLYLKEEVKTEDGENYAESVGAQFLEFSAKTESPSKFDDFLIKLIDEYLIFKKGKTSDGKIALTRESVLAKKKKKDCC
jgi:small GTP-binding protein